jgi:hypothetical protein
VLAVGGRARFALGEHRQRHSQHHRRHDQRHRNDKDGAPHVSSQRRGDPRWITEPTSESIIRQYGSDRRTGSRCFAEESTQVLRPRTCDEPFAHSGELEQKGGPGRSCPGPLTSSSATLSPTLPCLRLPHPPSPGAGLGAGGQILCHELSRPEVGLLLGVLVLEDAGRNHDPVPASTK